MQVYVNQHDFFINKIREHVDHGDDLYALLFSFPFLLEQKYNIIHRWSTISNPDESTPQAEPGLTELFGEIRATVAQESQIVQAVFPNPPLVMQVFLQRVFAQSVCPLHALRMMLSILPHFVDSAVYRTAFK